MASHSPLELTFNHIVFPPRLPGTQDSQIEDVERDLISRLLEATKTLKGHSQGEEELTVWQFIENSLVSSVRVNEGGHVNKAALLKALNDLEPHHALILHVAEQNCGMLIRRSSDEENEVIFEAFEASPTAEKALAAKGALSWDFPGIAVSIPLSVFENPQFQENLASFLEKASLELLEEFAAKAKKAGATITENRDTSSPALITQFLFTLLEVNGTRIYPPLLRKRIKDDICWDNAKVPWRRSPYWLILRVSVQRLLYLGLGEERGRMQYKLLMCCLLAKLLVKSIYVLRPELCDLLKKKLCRRMAKLMKEKQTASPYTLDSDDDLFQKIERICQDSVDVATASIGVQWSSFKKEIRRQIPKLPFRADQEDLHLSLPNSDSYLREVLFPLRDQRRGHTVVDPSTLGSNAKKSTAEQFDGMTQLYFALADLESSIETTDRTVPVSTRSCERHCEAVSAQIMKYLKAVCDAYNGNPEQMSIFILNILELWVHLDKCATVVYPLLLEYHPCFRPEMLDVLLLSRRHDLDRLQTIQVYLQRRCRQAQSMTIFDGPERGCFADRYFEFDDAHKIEELIELRRTIESASAVARDCKKAELDEVNAEYRKLTEKMAQTSCTLLRHPDGTHDIRGCSHCWFVRTRRRLKIQVHEDFLPEGNRDHYITQRRAIIFELGIPGSFSAYRDASWEIINTFCFNVTKPTSDSPKMLLSGYSQLVGFNKDVKRRFSLASTTKSYLGTHYNWKVLPATTTNVLLPLGLTFSYYDSGRELWAKDVPRRLSFAHNFKIEIPKDQPFASLYSSSTFAADETGPSSYEVVASITKCPTDITIHEYTAHQNLKAGASRRWLTVLAELGSSNVNFSTQDTMALFQHLALQAGPFLKDDTLRVMHVVFRDAQFCRRLIEQVNSHVETISANWRESYYMETLLTLTIRLCTLGCQQTSNDANDLLIKIRHITLKWVTLLRSETRITQEADVAERTARYGFMAALLCRRTFAPQVDRDENLDSESFSSYLEATLALQENLVVDLSKFTTSTRNMLVRDIKMTFRMQKMLRRLVNMYPGSLQSAIETVWPGAGNIPRRYTPWAFLPSPYEWWVTATVETTEHTVQQVIHYHVLEGHLLVDGQALGKLPPEIRDSEVLKYLFGNQRLLAFPSDLPGMSYVLEIKKQGYRIHLGYRNGQLIIRAQSALALLEFIPYRVFLNDRESDLPNPLVLNCVHWVNLQTGVLEVRRQPNIWKSQDGNWRINLRTRRGARRASQLVDPRSQLFASVAKIFYQFENPRELTVYQPSSKNLVVELKRMNLSFAVNTRHALHCRQLASEIDWNQDAGTLYGLQSMLVLRDGANHSQRSIITPLGKLHYRRRGIHVVIQRENDGLYARYTIDDVLGRLHCPPEARLLFNKAQLHAFTSFILPDPLTGRTGTEEALQCLQSGYCQPWNPLPPRSLEMLKTLTSLTPVREYYPEGLKKQQTVAWDPELTTAIQHDAYQLVVDAIIEKSERLSRFQHDQKGDEEVYTDEGLPVAHLRERARWRRSLYERPGTMRKELIQPPDLEYSSRDRGKSTTRVCNVQEIVTLLLRQPSSVSSTTNLQRTLKKWPIIGGYAKDFTPASISDCLRADLALEWGGLINLCRNCKNLYNVMFQLGLVAFAEGIDMKVLRTITAFFLLDELKTLKYPDYSTFTNFGIKEELTVDELIPYVRPCCKKLWDSPLSKRMRKLLRLEGADAIKKIHYDECQSESDRFVRFVLSQWPAPDIDIFTAEFEATHLDIDKAIEAILPLWQSAHANMKLEGHIKQVQVIIDKNFDSSNSIAAQFGTPSRVEIFGSLKRRDELIPRLEKDLLRQKGPATDSTSAMISNKHQFGSGVDQFAKSANARSQMGILENTPPSAMISNKYQVGSGVDQFAKSTNTGSQIGISENTPPSVMISNKHQVVSSTHHFIKSAKTDSQTGIPGSKTSSTKEIAELETIADQLLQSDCVVRSTYAQDLKQSIEALKLVNRDAKPRAQVDMNLDKEISQARELLHQLHVDLCNALSRGNSLFPWLNRAGLWPCMTPIVILEQLRSVSGCFFGPNMKSAFIAYAQATVYLQRLLRMKDASLKKDESRSSQEIENVGHVNWVPGEYPDWLLLEIDANMQIREEQITVAKEMISPSSGANSALQMNMGQGKTSVIMPMVACVLADGNMLARLLVPKALLSQTAQILQSRLGGLLGREITHIPFSRRTRTTSDNIGQYRALHEEAMRASGVILGIPEHVLSFKLSGLQRVSDSKLNEATEMISTQTWMDKVSRDILDECDFTLAAKTQLIYPSGSQLTVDGHPQRWEVTQVILGIAAQHLPDLVQEFPQSIDVVGRSALGFPVVYFLRRDVEQALIKSIVDDICLGRTSILPIWECTEKQRSIIRQFLSEEHVEDKVARAVSRLFPDTPKARNNVYLLRGLLVHGILILCLKKRWNVQYGLHPNRDPVAVPFHAKGVPSEQAEWGHPDVAIVFTCLAFYYEGLSQKQLRQSLQSVLTSDDPATEYDRWTQASASLPAALRYWNVINVDDDNQVAEIWNHLRFSTVVINRFLNYFVFPVHAKQFSIKLQASGWDVPLFKQHESFTTKGNRPCLTTGFSGTNDNRRLLPLTITQRDLDGLSHTNAEVLTYLLQKRSRKYIFAANPDGRRLSETELLDDLACKGIRILIDAGAFILEMDNRTVIKTWLQKDTRAQAGVYFGPDNSALVLYRTGNWAPLIATPFADNLENCVVYLDEAHTRGTDLKFPLRAHGALTLGLNQTKDHTVQAAMRLRKLGTTQSITFVAPPEVHQSILDVCEKDTAAKITYFDVITWLLDQTCSNNKELQSLYLAQGRDFCQRIQAAEDCKDFLANPSQRKAYLGVLQRPEAQDLAQLYDPRFEKVSTGVNEMKFSGKLAAFRQELQDRQQASDLFGSVSSSALEEVEQEREVAFEIEEEREVQRPKRMKPLQFLGLSETLRQFATTGILKTDTEFLKASMVLEETELGEKYQINGSSLLRQLYVSTEFRRTVQLKSTQSVDNYTRPVNWVLWSRLSGTGIVVIPEEAESLIPLLRATNSAVHLLIYAAPVTKQMLQFNELDFYSVPSLPVGYALPYWLLFEVGVLAGRLYFDFSEYDEVLRRLTVCDDGESSAGTTSKSTLAFLAEWLSLRRQGQDITHTPMGYVCQGWKLRRDHPFFTRRVADGEIPEEVLNRASYSPVEGAEEYESDGEMEEYYD